MTSHLSGLGFYDSNKSNCGVSFFDSVTEFNFTKLLPYYNLLRNILLVFGDFLRFL